MNEQIKPVKHRFNIIDLPLIILIAAALISLLLRNGLTSSIGIGQEIKKVEYEFLLENVREESCDQFSVEKELFLQSTNSSIGTIKLLYAKEPRTEYISLADGTLTTTVIPGRYDLKGVIAAEAKKTNEGYFLEDNTFLSAGSTYYAKFDTMHVVLTVLSVKEVGA